MEDDDAKPIFDAAFSAIRDIADEFVGGLNSFKRLNDFFKNETSHLPPFVIARIGSAVEDFHKICESHIEIVALVKMMALNVSDAGQMPSYPFATSKREKTDFVTITPQVEIGPYRADFVVDTPSGQAFLVECDGRDFHTLEVDAQRDEDIERRFGMKTYRLTGREIWNSDEWLPMFGRWCRGKFFDRSKDLWMQEWEHRTRRDWGK